MKKQVIFILFVVSILALFSGCDVFTTMFGSSEAAILDYASDYILEEPVIDANKPEEEKKEPEPTETKDIVLSGEKDKKLNPIMIVFMFIVSFIQSIYALVSKNGAFSKKEK